MILFFDTETTGKADLKSAPDASHQPRLVQLAALLTDDSGQEFASLNVIVRPSGFEIPESASGVHGITTDAALKYGLGLEAVLPMFAQLAFIPKTIVAHNIEFDLFVMTGEYIRAEFGIVPFDGAELFCTMKEMTEVCQIPGNYGFKWPKLIEAYRHCFNSDFENAHDALADVRACARIYFWLKALRAEKPSELPALP